MNVPFADLSWQETQIRYAREARFSRIIESAEFILGPNVAAFESRFASYCNVAHAVGVASGTDALAMGFHALGISAGDEVITTPVTFIASVSPLLRLGARPVFVDVDLATRNINLAQAEQAITSRTKAILVVHLYGDMPDMDALLAFANKHNLLLIEDAAQAHGATYKGRRAGSLGAVAAFSFYPGKNLGAYGDGGAVVTNDATVAGTVRKLRNHGGIAKYEHEMLGYNSRLDTLMAAVLDEKLSHLDEWNDMRREVARLYYDDLKGVVQLRLPPQNPDTNPAFHLFVIELLEGGREAFMSFLKKRGVASGIHYPKPLHALPALSACGYTAGDFPVSEAFTKRIVSLPIFPGMNSKQIAHVTDTVRKFYG